MSQEVLQIDSHDETFPAQVSKELRSDTTGFAQIVKHLGEGATESYFHGSNIPIKIGGNIHPGSRAIEDENGVIHASATTSERTAWAYAEDKEAVEGGRARVYKVVPSDGNPAKRLGPQIGEVNSQGFTIVDEINTKPRRQGTFPGINWSEYSPYTGVNHPKAPLWHIDGYQQDQPTRENPSPDETPLPGLGQEYVQTELQRVDDESGFPFV